ncbi:hypothetical protein [Paraburkholderia strydomiana]
MTFTDSADNAAFAVARHVPHSSLLRAHLLSHLLPHLPQRHSHALRRAV